MNRNGLEESKVINNYRMGAKDNVDYSESYEILFIIIVNFKLV
jgi:hypothetical protein